jgi:polyhydroxybutyrate depolymerase
MKVAALFVFAVAACQGRTAPTPTATSTAPPATTPTATAASTSPVTARPYATHEPRDWDRRTAAPLVVFLHGYGGSGAMHARALGLEDVADAHGFVLATPDGTVDSRGKHFWNATDACCDFDRSGVDDVAYLGALLDDIESKLPIDPKRVFVVGHSNGGFFAQRLACDLAPRVAAAVSLAGAGWKDASRCKPSEPVSVLEIHGDADDIIRMEGGRVFDLPVPEYPSVHDTLAGWARRDACGGAMGAGGSRMDFDAQRPGVDTLETPYAGCPTGIGVELWTVKGGSHFLAPTHAALDAVWAWLEAHPKR